MRPSFRDTCGAVLGGYLLVALFSDVPGGEAFLVPTTVRERRVAFTQGGLRASKVEKQLRPSVRGVEQRMAAVGGEDQLGDSTGFDSGEKASSSSSSVSNVPTRRGRFHRVKSLFGRKAAAAAAVSALVGAGAPGSAQALFGRGKSPEMPSVPAIEQRLENAAGEVTEAAEGMMETMEQAQEEAGEAAGEVLSEIGEAIDRVETPGVDSEAEMEGGVGGVTTAVATADKGVKKAGSRGVSSAELIKAEVLENKELIAVVVAGVAGSRYLLVKAGGKPGRGSGRGRRRGGGGKGLAPKSPFAGIGKPRVSPEVAAADLKRKADSLKSIDFDVDEDLFGDAVSDLPSRPPPPTPPAAEPSPSPAEAMKEVVSGRDAATAAADSAAKSFITEAAEHADEAVAAAAAAAAAAAEVAADGTAAADADYAISAANIATPEPTPAAAPLVAEPTPPPATFYSKKPEKSKRKGAPILNLFKRDSGPQRATTMADALAADTADVAVFRQALAAVLARSAPAGAFNVKEPSLLEEVSFTPEDFEGEAGAKAAEKSRVSALGQLMEKAGLSLQEGAHVVADVVNAMVVKLTDAAVTSKDDASIATASDALLKYMDGAGELFVALCPGIALDPQIKYNGTYKRGKLEKVFEAAAKSTLKSMGEEGQMVSLDRLQDLFSIKKSKADSITQKIMMELMMKMMSEGDGEGGDAENLEKMMAAMGGAEGMGGMAGMPGMGARTPEDHKKEVEALKAMVDSGDCPKEEVDALRKMYTDAGMDIDTLVNDPTMESGMDADAKEVVVLLRKLLAMWPKK